MTHHTPPPAPHDPDARLRDVKARRVEIAAVLSEWKRAYVVDGIERYRLEG